jgi:uncharacterized FAD-dependent dehydrogenase
MFDVCVVGSGPAGIFAAMELVDSCNVLVLELGRNFKDRLYCRVISSRQTCIGCCRKCNIITGFGGAFSSQSGGVLSLYPAGSFLLNYFDSEEDLVNMYETAIEVWKNFTKGKMNFEGSLDKIKITDFSRKVGEVGGVYKHFNGFRINKVVLRDAVYGMEHFLSRKATVKYGSEVIAVSKEMGAWRIECRNGEWYLAKAVLFATGRKGNHFTSKQLNDLGVKVEKSGIDLGIRLELKGDLIDYLAALHPDIKIRFDINGEEVRTFCFCPKGRLTQFNQDSLCGTKSMNFLEGYIDDCKPSERTNISFLHRINFDSIQDVWKFQVAFEDRYSSLGGKVVAQRYMDIGRSVFSPLPKSTTLRDYMIGSVFQVMPEKSVYVILEAIRRFAKLANRKILDKDAIVCAPEIGNFWPEVRVDKFFQTSVLGIFVAGDALGFTRGALQGCVTGMRVAKGLKIYLRKE